MCSWFSLKVDAPDEASFSSKISEGPKSSDELVFPRSWTKVLSFHSLLQPQIQMETAIIEQHIFLGQDPFKLQVNLERRGCQWRNLGVDHQGTNQASSTTSKAWTQILGAANAVLVCHLHIWMREIKLQLCSLVNLFFQSQIWTLPLIVLERRPHAGAGWHYAMTGSPHALADPLATSFFCVLLRQDCTWHKGLCTVLIAHRRPLEQTFLTPLKKQKSDFV